MAGTTRISRSTSFTGASRCDLPSLGTVPCRTGGLRLSLDSRVESTSAEIIAAFTKPAEEVRFDHEVGVRCAWGLLQTSRGNIVSFQHTGVATVSG